MRGLNPAAKNNRFDLHPKLLPLEGRVPRHPPHRAPASCRSSYTAVTTQRRLRTREALGVRQRSGAVKALRALRHSFWQSGKLHPTHGHTDLARLPRATWAGRRGSHSSGWENQRLWVETCRRQLSEVGRVPVRPGGVGGSGLSAGNLSINPSACGPALLQSSCHLGGFSTEIQSRCGGSVSGPMALDRNGAVREARQYWDTSHSEPGR